MLQVYGHRLCFIPPKVRVVAREYDSVRSIVRLSPRISPGRKDQRLSRKCLSVTQNENLVAISFCYSPTGDRATAERHAQRLESCTAGRRRMKSEPRPLAQRRGEVAWPALYHNTDAATLGRMIQVARGGDNSDDTRRVACEPCNNRKSDRLISACGWLKHLH
jgi:hypothetical protein